jgi:hypothetical protein
MITEVKSRRSHDTDGGIDQPDFHHAMYLPYDRPMCAPGRGWQVHCVVEDASVWWGGITEHINRFSTYGLWCDPVSQPLMEELRFSQAPAMGEREQANGNVAQFFADGQRRMHWRSGAASTLHEVVQFRRGHDVVEVLECAPILHFAGRVEQATHRRTIERGGEADPSDTDRCEFGHRE